MVVVEEEYINKHIRKLAIKTEAENILKKDVHCSVSKSVAERGECVLSEKISGLSIEIYNIEISKNTMGLVLCVNSDCNLIDVLTLNEGFDELEGFGCR